MTTVVGLTAQRMQEIEAAAIVDADIVGGNLILTRHDGVQVNAGPAVGPAGPQGPQGIAAAPIPGEIKLWPSATLPDGVQYGLWAWANGDIFDIATYPKAAANIDDIWNTANGLANPGVGKFRVPDLRGLVPAGLDAMPVGAARANRMTRADAIVLAKKTGEETHKLIIAEHAIHTHIQTQHRHDITHDHLVQTGASVGAGAYVARGTGVVADLGGNGSPIKYNSGDASGYVTAVNQNSGGDVPHETVQPTIMVPYIVKLDD